MHWLRVLAAVAAALLATGCVTTAARALDAHYYVTLGSPADPLVAATGLTALVRDPEARTAALLAIADHFIARQRYDDAALLLDDAAETLAASSVLDNDQYYPASQRITAYNPAPGSLERAARYLDTIERYQRISDPRDRTEALLRAALNELLRSDQGVAHQRLLMRYLEVTRALSFTDDTLLNRLLEAVLVYHLPILYSDLLQFLIAFYNRDDLPNLNAKQTFDQYLRLFVLEYRGRYDWVSLAVHYALHRDGLVSTAELNAVRALVLDTPVQFSSVQEVRTIARGIARSGQSELLRLLRRLTIAEPRCDIFFSDQSPANLLVLGEFVEQVAACISTAKSRAVRAERARTAATTAIAFNAAAQDIYIPLALSGDNAQRIPAYLTIAESYYDGRQTTRARQYLAEFTARYDREVVQYETAQRFATLYDALYSEQRLIEQLSTKRNPLFQVALLLQLDRHSDSSVTTYRQVITDTIDQYTQ